MWLLSFRALIHYRLRGIIHPILSPYRGQGLWAVNRMSYSRNFLLNIRNCWKVWKNSWRGSPVCQISSDVWARLKFLDLLAPRRGHRGGRSQSLFKDKRRIDIVNGRRNFNTSNSQFLRRSNPSNLINILPTAIVNNNGSPATDVTQCHAMVTPRTQAFQKSKVSVAHLNAQSIKDRNHLLQVSC